MKSYWKRAQFFLAVGLLFLFSCLGLAQNIPVSENPNMTEIFREGLIIFGWVSIWKPIEVILFDWYQPYEDLKYYKKLKKTEIDIYFESSDSQTTVSAKDIYSGHQVRL